MSEGPLGTGPLPADLLNERVRHVELAGDPGPEDHPMPVEPSLNADETPPPPPSAPSPGPQLETPWIFRAVHYQMRDMSSTHLFVWTIVGCVLVLTMFLPVVIRLLELVTRLFVLDPPALFLLLVVMAGGWIYFRRKQPPRR